MHLRAASAGRVSVAPAGEITAQQAAWEVIMLARRRCVYCRYGYRNATLSLRQQRLSPVTSAYIALPVNLLRYVFHGAGSAQGAASRRRPLYPRAPASKIAAARSLRLIPAGFGSGRGSVRAKHGPQPASMRAAPAFRERLSDFEAVSTGSFSDPSASGDLGL